MRRSIRRGFGITLKRDGIALPLLVSWVDGDLYVQLLCFELGIYQIVEHHDEE